MMRTLVGVVLDRSGSMSTILADTIGGFNSFIDDQRRKNQDQVYVVTQFDTEYEVRQDGVELDDVETLTRKNFVPRGGTALLDAMGQTIASMDAQLANDKTIQQALLVVITDGEENSSKEFTREQVFDLISQREKQGNWEFAFLGAGQDAIGQARSLGINNSQQYAANGLGAKMAFNNISRSTECYSSGGTANLADASPQIDIE